MIFIFISYVAKNECLHDILVAKVSVGHTITTKSSSYQIMHIVFVENVFEKARRKRFCVGARGHAKQSNKTKRNNVTDRNQLVSYFAIQLEFHI